MLCRTGGLFASFPGQEEVRGAMIHALERRAAGGFWIGADRGLGYWDGAGIRWVPIPQVNQAWALAETRGGLLWIGTTDRLVGFDPKASRVTRSFSAEELHRRTGKTGVNVVGLMLDRRERLWIGSNQGTWRLDGLNADLTLINTWAHGSNARFAEDAQGVV